MKLIFIGAPGAGKGTQAKIVSEHFNIAHISTGDLLRAETAKKTQLGLKIVDIMNSGGLVSDEIVTALLKNRIKEDDCKNGFILDGYPRNISQAEGLENAVGKIDKVILFSVDDEAIIRRMSGRRACPECGRMYHIKNNPPKKEGICDGCGGKLIQRKDDNADTVKNRLSVYHNTTAPLIKYYSDKGILSKINGMRDIDEISSQTIKVLEEGND